MTNQKTSAGNNLFGKMVLCVSLSTIYIAMLAWPFGLSENGYVATRAILAGTIMFAVSIPVWIVNIKRELSAVESKERLTATASEHRVGNVAMGTNN